MEPPYSRSRTTLFIKNLPAGSNSVTVRSLLESVKAISRILVPPSGVIALVEFTTPAAATQAVKALAYRKVGNSLIYTERAPTDIWKADTVVEDQKPAKSSAALSEGNDGIAGTPREAGSSSSLYVTGLSLQASAATFKTLFQGFPGFVYAHLHAQSVAGDASRGHQSGFVGFSTPEDAQRARQAMHGHILNGQVLSVVEARSRALDVPPVGKSGSAKMIIKNLPFEVERQDLRKLLS